MYTYRHCYDFYAKLNCVRVLQKRGAHYTSRKNKKQKSFLTLHFRRTPPTQKTKRTFESASSLKRKTRT